MKKTLSICALLFIAQIVSAQKTKKVSSPGIYPILTQQYSVLKSDPLIKQGEYKLMLNYNDQIITKGYYKNNLKDSLWQEYINQTVLAAQGYYKNGIRVGIWEFRDDYGVVNNKYDYTEKKLIYHKYDLADSSFYTVINKTDTVKKVILDRAPIYLGGNGIFFRPILMGLRYPKDAHDKGIEGRVIIEFTLTETGEVKDPHIKQSIYPSLDQEGLTRFAEAENNWLPAILNGKPVSVLMKFPIGYRLEYRPVR